MVSNHVTSLIRQAVTTFTCKADLFYQHLETLKELLDKTTARDVNLHPQFMSEALWLRRNKAPVTYVDIYEDCNLTVGIFILKPGMKLPLHDHPHMHGLIKVIAGAIKITSFSLDTEKTKKFEKTFMPEDDVNRKLLTAEKSCELVAGIDSESCLLEPNRRNLHEIESVGGPAAFIDILSPPYETYIPNIGQRKCKYYKILKEVAPQIYNLEETGSPSWYWNDTFPYTGPKLYSIQ